MLESARAKLTLKSTPASEAAPSLESPPAPDPVSEAWGRLPSISLNPSTLKRNLVITASRSDPAHAAFDVLRTKLVQAMAERGWRRVGVTSPTKGCGKSFVAANLAITLSRYEKCRTILLDMDLRLSGLTRTLGVRNPGVMADLLRGLVPAEEFLHRVESSHLMLGPSLAVGLNGQPEPFAAEIFQQSGTFEVLRQMDALLAPQLVLLDLPPALAQDDVLTLKPHLDCILMVAGGGITTASELREASRRIGEDLPILGVVLNRAEGQVLKHYTY
jgi:protein-tyrosine kinase